MIKKINSSFASKWPKWPFLDNHIVAELFDVLQQETWKSTAPQYRSSGMIDRVLNLFRSHYGLTNGLLLRSGSQAITLAIQVLVSGRPGAIGIPAGVWKGCTDAVIASGRQPVFFDLDASGRPILNEFVREHADQVVSILAVHNIASIMDIEATRSTFPEASVIEDIAHCFGTLDANGRFLGTQGDVAITSFQATKTIGAFSGGAIFFASDDKYQLAKSMIAKEVTKLQLNELGLGDNSLMSQFDATLLYAQLKKFEELRRQCASGLSFFRDTAAGYGFCLRYNKLCLLSGTIYGLPIRIKASGSTGPSVNDIIEEIEHRTGLICDRLYRPIPKKFMEANVQERDFPIAHEIYETEIAIPHQAFLANHDDLLNLSVELSKLVD